MDNGDGAVGGWDCATAVIALGVWPHTGKAGKVPTGPAGHHTARCCTVMWNGVATHKMGSKGLLATQGGHTLRWQGPKARANGSWQACPTYHCAIKASSLAVVKTQAAP